jgi:hypothetical protein
VKGALVVLAGACALAACVPPAGLPSSLDGVGPERGALLVSSGVGGSGERMSQQTQIAAGARPSRHFGIEGGLAHSLMRFSSEEGNQVVAHSVLPYLRPTFFVDRFSLGVALSGLGMGGGGGGAAYGLAGVRVAYAKDGTGVYGEWLGHISSVVGRSTTESSSQQRRVGVSVQRPVGAMRLGGAVEIYDIDESFLGKGQHFDHHSVGAMVRVFVTKRFRD